MWMRISGRCMRRTMSMNTESGRTSAWLRASVGAGCLAVSGWVASGLRAPGAGDVPIAPLPVGSLVAFAGEKGGVPEADGWMLCDGRELAVSAYPALHTAIGRAWGGAENGATFRLPDLRGRFVRGVNYDADGPMRDPDRDLRVASAEGGGKGNAVGTLQEDLAGPHTHPLVGASDAVGQGLGAEVLRFYATKIPDAEAPMVRNDGVIQPGMGSETRPRNVAVNWIIRVR